MYKIVEKKSLGPKQHLIVVEAKEVSKKAKAGQFFILRIDKYGERIPLTIADFDPKKGTITSIFQEVGKTTEKLAGLKEGDSILDFVGPLGVPIHVEKYGTIVCIGGGIGTAPVYPQARALKEAGNKVISIIGSRSSNLLFWRDKMKAASDELHIVTDDGTEGVHGFVTDVLSKLLKDNVHIDKVIAIGPLPMMKAVCKVTKPCNIPTTVSLNAIMVDGTGMCGCCRVTVGGKVKFACVDGPDFDGLTVDFDELSLRQRRFTKEEKESLLLYRNMLEKASKDKGECRCRQ
ncbi:MAG: sulfide/dihydroorotate dehydrogenase-like FAD/NAD-binding protein [bacterium]|nr:sulfide/dihydroorotate dehydrogenase-like FAD/NAD-binding protein [bacterium]